MSGGMRIEHLKELPLRYQEQAAMAVVAQSMQATLVAGCPEKQPQKVTVRRLTFTSRKSADRYGILRDALQMYVIDDLQVLTHEGKVCAITYRILWNGTEWLHSIPWEIQWYWKNRIDILGLCPMIINWL